MKLTSYAKVNSEKLSLHLAKTANHVTTPRSEEQGFSVRAVSHSPKAPSEPRKNSVFGRRRFSTGSPKDDYTTSFAFGASGGVHVSHGLKVRGIIAPPHPLFPVKSNHDTDLKTNLEMTIRIARDDPF